MFLGAVLLLIAAFALIAGELFIPSHGILTICAALFALLSVIFAYRSAPAVGLVFAIILLIASPVVLFYAVRVYPHTPVGKRVILAHPGVKTTNPFANETARLTALIGQTGITVTLLRPAGIADFNGDRVDVMSESEVIEANTKVQAIRLSSMKVIVRAIA